MSDKKQALQKLHLQLEQCGQCTLMTGPPVHGLAVDSSVMLIGQAPGFKEVEVLKPFAWTAGKKLFSWFEQIGMAETEVRQRITMSAICRCYPGKKAKQGDRVPTKEEIRQCSNWLQQEVNIIKPQLVIPVGKLAISQFMPVTTLAKVIGTKARAKVFEHPCDVISLPHPSGASTWYYTEPGKTLLQQALKLIKQHSAWQKLL
ncbi:MAG: uracil-DNA glycosylase [Methylococcales bacterium]|nr:uracil-DNA glycosylase [Methylococcales bacterium]MBT7446127.1 uracil-DNA glycosylase [Methylococcales bacterium]